MTWTTVISDAVPELLTGAPARAPEGRARSARQNALIYLLLLFLGAGAYGTAMGAWRAPEQALFNIIKFPLVLVGTAFGNALINGMLAPLFGINLRFRDSLMLVLMSFSIAAVILGSFAPLLYFLILNVPSLELRESSQATYGFVLLTQIAVVAFAGITANLKLLKTLEGVAPSKASARAVLVAWLSVNLFLGAQLCWNLRPFIGQPGLPVQFLRPNAFEGTFYEAALNALRTLLNQ